MDKKTNISFHIKYVNVLAIAIERSKIPQTTPCLLLSILKVFRINTRLMVSVVPTPKSTCDKIYGNMNLNVRKICSTYPKNVNSKWDKRWYNLLTDAYSHRHVLLAFKDRMESLYIADNGTYVIKSNENTAYCLG